MTDIATPADPAATPSMQSATPSSEPNGKRRSRVPQPMPPMSGARLFVSVVFLVLGAAFIASTASLVNEFWDTDWQAMLLLHSHLFVFFPTLGLLALAAFHLPATVFTHMYWTRIPNGRLRFVLGTVTVIVLTGIFSFTVLDAPPREIWEVAPRVLAADVSSPVSCGGDGRAPCSRVALLSGLRNLREEAQKRIGLGKFARLCATDKLLETPDDFTRVRYCFAAGGMLSGGDCCTTQNLYAKQIDTYWANSEQRSRTAKFDRIALPLKTFFVIVVVLIGVLLVSWRRLLESHYARDAPAIERALLVGAAAMLPWPFMDYAYMQAIQALDGRWSSLPQLRLSLVIAPWALLLLIFFLGRMGRKIERLGQLAGAGASTVAVLRYEDLNEYAVRFVGVGAPIWMVGLLVLFAVVCLAALLKPDRMDRAITKAMGPRPGSTPQTPAT